MENKFVLVNNLNLFMDLFKEQFIIQNRKLQTSFLQTHRIGNKKDIGIRGFTA